MTCVTKENFLQPTALKRERYALPECGDAAYVNVRELSADQLVALQEKYGASKETNNLVFLYDVLSLTLVDDNGDRLFECADDVKVNFRLSVNTLQGLGEFSLHVGGLNLAKKN